MTGLWTWPNLIIHSPLGGEEKWIRWQRRSWLPSREKASMVSCWTVSLFADKQSSGGRILVVSQTTIISVLNGELEMRCAGTKLVNSPHCHSKCSWVSSNCISARGKKRDNRRYWKITSRKTHCLILKSGGQCWPSWGLQSAPSFRNHQWSECQTVRIGKLWILALY